MTHRTPAGPLTWRRNPATGSWYTTRWIAELADHGRAGRIWTLRDAAGDGPPRIVGYYDTLADTKAHAALWTAQAVAP